MREIFSYSKRNSYPHMSVADTEIWERFLAKFPDEYDRVQYDFHVGDAPPFNPLLDDGTDANQDMLYKLRIDVIGHIGADVDIVEIKPNAGPSAIGQIQSYKTLYERDETQTGRVNMAIITDTLKPNMFFLCTQAGIKLIVV